MRQWFRSFFGPVYQTELCSVWLDFNLFFERALSHADGTEARYQWQAPTRLNAARTSTRLK